MATKLGRKYPSPSAEFPLGELGWAKCCILAARGKGDAKSTKSLHKIMWSTWLLEDNII